MRAPWTVRALVARRRRCRARPAPPASGQARRPSLQHPGSRRAAVWFLSLDGETLRRRGSGDALREGGAAASVTRRASRERSPSSLHAARECRAASCR